MCSFEALQNGVVYCLNFKAHNEYYFAYELNVKAHVCLFTGELAPSLLLLLEVSWSRVEYKIQSSAGLSSGVTLCQEERHKGELGVW